VRGGQRRATPSAASLLCAAARMRKWRAAARHNAARAPAARAAAVAHALHTQPHHARPAVTCHNARIALIVPCEQPCPECAAQRHATMAAGAAGAAIDVTRFSELSERAVELCAAGRWAAAVEKTAAAGACAAALGQPDCLLVAQMQIYQSQCLLRVAATAPGGEASSEAAAARRRAYVELLPTAMATLSRRRADAPTLAAACRPHETAWYLAQEAATCAREGEALEAELLSPMIYVAIVQAADLALIAILMEVAPAAYMTQYASFVAEALDMLAVPRARTEMILTSESGLIGNMTRHAGHLATAKPAVAAVVLPAWRRLRASGVMEGDSRGLAEGPEVSAAALRSSQAAAARDAEAMGLHACARAGCGAREVHAAQHKKCAACRRVAYCGRDCQAADWPAHKAACKAARKAALAAAAGAVSAELD
jgi:hypothetical protein